MPVPPERKRADPVDADLKVDLEAVRAREGRTCNVDRRVPTEWIAAALEKTDGRADSDGWVAWEIAVLRDETVCVRGKLEVGFAVPCARCLADADVSVKAEVCVTYVPASRPRGELAETESPPEGIELEATALDEMEYTGRYLELQPLIGEQVLLAYPIRALCGRGEACRGLCSVCGADLNEAGIGSCSRCSELARSTPSADAAETEESPETDVTGRNAWKQALRKLREP